MTDDCCGDKLSDSLKEKFNRFLKDNPLFLRSCLLYKYFEKNHFSEAHSSFLEDVGNDVVNQKDLDYWFNLFEKGKIAEYKKPIKNMYKAMWDDKQSLRTCVLYELMRSDDFPDSDKGLIRKKYNRFCNNMRGAVMNYDEFEFWFKRFQTEDFDMDIKWDKMKKYAELNNISIDASIKIHEEKDQRVLMLQKYLKNNPIAFRFLFSFPQNGFFSLRYFDEDVGQKYSRRVFNSDLIDFWSYTFKEKGNSVDKEQRPSFFENLFTSDKQSVLTCILYESLRNLRYYEKNVHDPVFKKYMTSFSTVMSYKEFNFWYYRFHEGQFDMDIEPKYDQSIPELNRLPELVIETVVDRLNYVDRCSLRRMSYKLCRIIDSRRITINSLKLEFSEHDTFISYGTERISYIQHGGVCHNDYGRRKRRINGKNHLDLALKDLSLLLRDPKLKIKNLFLEFKDLIKDDTDDDYDDEDSDEDSEEEEEYWSNNGRSVDYEISEFTIHKRIYKAFKSIDHQFHVESLSIKLNYIEEAIKILPFFKPGVLETIEIEFLDGLVIENDAELIENMLATEQWKQASHFKTTTVNFEIPIESFFHFKTFYIMHPGIDADDTRSIREKLFTSPQFQSCVIFVEEEGFGEERNFDFFELFPHERDYMLENIRDELGESLPDDYNTYHFPIPNSNELFLWEFSEQENLIEIQRKKKNGF